MQSCKNDLLQISLHGVTTNWTQILQYTPYGRAKEIEVMHESSPSPQISGTLKILN